MDAKAFSSAHELPVIRGINREGESSQHQTGTGAFRWREEDHRCLSAHPKLPRLPLLPGELSACSFLARRRMLQERH